MAVKVDDGLRIETDITHSPWPNYVMLNTNLIKEIDTEDERNASWQWEIESEWVRLS